jgi:hypothetical protein
VQQRGGVSTGHLVLTLRGELNHFGDGKREPDDYQPTTASLGAPLRQPWAQSGCQGPGWCVCVCVGVGVGVGGGRRRTPEVQEAGADEGGVCVRCWW